MMVGGGGGGCEGEVTGRAVAGRTARARGAHPTSMALGERRNVPVALELDERPLVAVHLQQHRVSHVHGGRFLLLGTRGRRWRARKSAKLRHRSTMRRRTLPAMRCDASVWMPAGDDCAEWIEIHVRAPREWPRFVLGARKFFPSAVHVCQTFASQLASRAFHFEAHARAAPASSTRWIPTRTRGSPTRPARRLARSPPGHTSTRATRRTRTYVRGRRRRTGGAKRCTRDTSATAGGPARRSSGWSARRRSPAPPRADAPRSRRGTYQPESA
jgi:hypothetical protein